MEKLDGTIFLKEITEKLNTRIRQLEEGIEKGQKEIENMHTHITGKITLRWTNTDMRIMIISRLFFVRQMQTMKRFN